jgi:hypothetical protein
MTWVASTAATASHSWATSTNNADTSLMPQDKSYRNTAQEKIRENGGSQRHAGKIFSLFSKLS